MAGRKTKPSTEIETIEFAIEDALRPGDFIEYDFSWSFTSGLEAVRSIIENFTIREPVRGIDLIETFIAACYEKADEIDDSSGSFGDFVEALFCSWVNARQRADCAAKETVDRLLAWIDNDDYGFTYNLEKEVPRFLNEAGLEEFTAAIRARYEAEMKKEHHRSLWGETLKSIYAAGGDFDAYLSICNETELLPVDCETLAEMRLSNGNPAEALKWVEKGLEIESDTQVYRGSSYKLVTRKYSSKPTRTWRGRFIRPWDCGSSMPKRAGITVLPCLILNTRSIAMKRPVSKQPGLNWLKTLEPGIPENTVSCRDLNRWLWGKVRTPNHRLWIWQKNGQGKTGPEFGPGVFY